MKDVRKVFCLSKQNPEGQGGLCAALHGVTESGTTERLNNNSKEDLYLDLFLHLNVQLFYLCLLKKTPFLH